MSDTDFIFTNEKLKQIASDVLHYAKQKGASATVVGISEGNGLSLNVRKGAVETIERNQDKDISLTVFIGKKRGNATTSDFSKQSLSQAVDAAYNIAQYTSEDVASGLPDAIMLENSPKDLDLYHHWDIDVTHAIELAVGCEQAALDLDKRITNTEGANVNVSHSHFVLANSAGFLAGYPYSNHSISVSPIAGQGAQMQRDYWFTSSRNPKQLKDPKWVGRHAAERALARLDAQRISTRKCPVLFEAPIAVGLISALIYGLSGGALYRKASFLTDSLGTQIFPNHIDVIENPHILGGQGSAPFDDEGVKTSDRKVIDLGVVNGYMLSSYSARKLGMQTTGNAGGAHNLFLKSTQTKSDDNYAEMIKKMGTGLIVTDLMGQGINYVTGDYSRGASGFWVENGVIQYPVQEITIAGNLKDMFAQIVAVGADVIRRGSITCGSILIEQMIVAGVD